MFGSGAHCRCLIRWHVKNDCKWIPACFTPPHPAQKQFALDNFITLSEKTASWIVERSCLPSAHFPDVQLWNKALHQSCCCSHHVSCSTILPVCIHIQCCHLQWVYPAPQYCQSAYTYSAATYSECILHHNIASLHTQTVLPPIPRVTCTAILSVHIHRQRCHLLHNIASPHTHCQCRHLYIQVKRHQHINHTPLNMKLSHLWMQELVSANMCITL